MVAALSVEMLVITDYSIKNDHVSTVCLCTVCLLLPYNGIRLLYCSTT